MPHLFEYLYMRQKRRRIEETLDGIYYFNNRDKLLSRVAFTTLAEARTEFEIICANAVLRSLDNINRVYHCLLTAREKYQEITDKEQKCRLINAEVEQLKAELPYIDDDGNKIYFPVFSRVFNLIVNDNASHLLDLPDSLALNKLNVEMINPFNAYSFALFGSEFTQLIELEKSLTSRAYYHVDFQMVFFINDQGTVDNVLALFDNRMKKIEVNHMIKRLKGVVSAYYDLDRTKMIDELYHHRLISKAAYTRLKKRGE